MDKASIRQLYLEKRQQLSKESWQELQDLLLNRLFSHRWSSYKVIHIFMAIADSNEPDLSPLRDHLWQQYPEINIVVPKVLSPTTLDHISIDPQTSWAQGRWGIPEPETGPTVAPCEIDLVLVPLLSFDQHGHRVGYGKGFYDRFLGQCGDHTEFMGVSFWGPGPDIDTEASDVALHQVFTPHQVYQFRE